ncbi:MAG: CPBP family intramembrane glutamic endopeptidase [Acidobacteriota bacterium]
MLLLGVQFQIIGGIIAALATPESGATGRGLSAEDRNGLHLGLMHIVGALACVATTAYFCRIRRGPPIAEYLAIRWPGWRAMILWGAAAAAVPLIRTEGLRLLGYVVEPDYWRNVLETAGHPALLLFGVVIAAPLMEETVFRGFLYAGLAPTRLGHLGAVVVTTALWLLPHVQYDEAELCVLAASGLLLGIVRWRTGSTVAAFLVHGVMNAVEMSSVMRAVWS